MEQAKGHSGNNIVTVLMNFYHFTLQEASDYVGTYSKDLMSRFESAKTRIPSWGPDLDVQVAQYVDAMERWVRGNLEYVNVLDCHCHLADLYLHSAAGALRPTDISVLVIMRSN